MKFLLLAFYVLFFSCLAKAEQPFEDGVKIEVVMSKLSRTEGGDFDDQRQKIQPKLKLISMNNEKDYSGYKASFISIGRSTVDRKVFKALSKHDFSFSLMTRQTHVEEIPPVNTEYDTTGVIFGFKYDGWILIVKDPSDQIVATKSTSVFFEKEPKEADLLQEGAHFDRTLKKVSAPVSRY